MMTKIGVAMLTCSVVLVGCGGGGGSKSGLKPNELLGNLPAIHADYKAVSNESAERISKVKNSGNWQKALEVAAKEATIASENSEKFQADSNAEWTKIDGKDVPFAVSKAFEKLNVQVESVKLCAEYHGFTAVVTAKKDFDVSNSWNASQNNYTEYKELYFRILAKDGSELDRSNTYLAYLGFELSKSYKKGESILFNNKTPRAAFSLGSKPESWVDFASIEFITQEEYNK